MVKNSKLENIPNKYLKIIENFRKGDERLLALMNYGDSFSVVVFPLSRYKVIFLRF